MKILYLSPWFPYPPTNGSKIRIYNLIRSLSKQHDIRLISFIRDGELIDPEGLKEICQVEAMVPYSEFNPKSLKSVLGYLSPKPRSIIDTYSKQMANELKRTIAQESPDLIIASEATTAVYAGRKWAIPCIYDELQIGLSYQLGSTSSSSINKLYKKLYWVKNSRYTKYLIEQYNACTVASEAERDLLSQLMDVNEHIHVIPNGVDLELNRPGIAKPKPNTLIYNGALTFNANYDAISFFLQDIFPSIHKKIPEVTLKITGSTEGVDISHLPIDNSITFTSFLPDIRPAVAEAWACIVPLRLGGGTRLKILEAMALGTPVIATTKAAEGLSVTSEKNILLADTPEEFSMQAVRLLREERLRVELARNARELVEKYYGWDAIGNLFEEIVEITINQKMQQNCGRTGDKCE